jgi:single-strand DNA-binding protein
LHCGGVRVGVVHLVVELSTERVHGWSHVGSGPRLVRAGSEPDRVPSEEERMNATYLTVAGRIATTVERYEYDRGTRVSFRVASTERRYDRESGEWGDAGTIYLTVKCWRQLAENVVKSLRIGDPVIVHGRLIGRSFDRDGRRESVMEMDADAVGPDLRWSYASVTRTKAAAGAPAGVGAADSAAVSREAAPYSAALPMPRNGDGEPQATVEGAVSA